MSFSTFSKAFTANMFTSVENQFITKYLPQAEGDAVKAYLYGLYLCQCADEFDAVSCAKLLKITPERLVQIFDYWEECDLVHVLSRNPLYVEYLPVNAAIGKPKPIKAEKYASFNREFYKQLQRAGKEFKPYEMQRILEFLENNPMEQQAFLLVSEYCMKKDGDKLSCQHILNKASKMCREHKYTLEQAEKELADFNEHERDMAKILSALGIYRKVQDSDYDFLEKWKARGMQPKTLLRLAENLKKGSLSTLDALAEELYEKQILTESDAAIYLERRAELTATVFQVAKRLGVKVQNPRPYAEAYAEKWLEHGYDSASLALIASFAMKLGYGFPETDALLDELYQSGIVDIAGVKAYCAERDKQFRLLQSLQSVCGVIKKTQAALDMVATWKSWAFSDEMIMQAAQRGAQAANPLPYINKLLSEWKRTGVSTPADIPEKAAPSKNYQAEAAAALDERAERERYYAELSQKAAARVEAARKKANASKEFIQADGAYKKLEIALARAEALSPEKLPSLREEFAATKAKRLHALEKIGLSPNDFLPKYVCEKCSDTGFLPDGHLCDCYPQK